MEGTSGRIVRESASEFGIVAVVTGWIGAVLLLDAVPGLDRPRGGCPAGGARCRDLGGPGRAAAAPEAGLVRAQTPGRRRARHLRGVHVLAAAGGVRLPDRHRAAVRPARARAGLPRGARARAPCAVPAPPPAARRGHRAGRRGVGAVGGPAVGRATTSSAPSGSPACSASSPGARRGLLYVGAFVVVSYLELLGTALGTWAWAAHDPVLARHRPGQPAVRCGRWLRLVRPVRAAARAAAARARSGGAVDAGRRTSSGASVRCRGQPSSDRA